MWPVARRFFLILCALALIGGSTISFAATVTAAGPCAHEHSGQNGTAPAHPDHHGAECLACCLGACAAMPGLPPRTSLTEAAFSAKTVTWWETGTALSGRSIAPDPGPPRTIA